MLIQKSKIPLYKNYSKSGISRSTARFQVVHLCLMPDSKLLCTYPKMAYEFRRFIKGWLRPMLILLMKSKHLSFQSIKLHSSDPELNKQV